MLNTCRVGDAHACGNIDTGGSSNVYANGRAIHCVTHSQSHCDIQVGGSPNVYSNGLAHARIGDMCGPMCLCPFIHPDTGQVSGSPDVFTN